MKVLILHQHFRTPTMGGAIRSYYLAKALVEKGIETVVVTGSNDQNYRKEFLEGIEIHYLPVSYENAFGFAKRSVSFMIYVWKAIRLAKKIKGVSLCYAISTPLTVGIAALRLKSKLKVPYIFEVGDLWPDAPVQMGFVKNSFLSSLLYRLEKSIYKDAESIVALSDSIKEGIENKISGKKIHVVPNFADCEYYRPETKDSSLEERFSVRGKFVVSYIGAIGAANGLEYFIECANAATKAGLPVHFILCGDGAMLSSLKNLAAKLKLKNISFTGFVDRPAVKEIMNVTDAAFVCYKNVPVLETGSPNKYFDALASGKMIITNFGGWIKNEIESSSCGFALNPKNPADFVNMIAQYLVDSSRLARSQKAARLLAEEKYHRSKLSIQFASIFLKR